MMGWRYPDSGSDILLASEPEILLFGTYCNNKVGKGGLNKVGELNAGFDAESKL